MRRARVLVAGLALLALAALANAWLGAYHAGVEWGFWQGPTECTGPVLDLGKAGSLLDNLDKVKVIRCDEVQWRFLGLSLAGYNVLISLADGRAGGLGHRWSTSGLNPHPGGAACFALLSQADELRDHRALLRPRTQRAAPQLLRARYVRDEDGA